MNFLCDQCKQKYHVADEKLRGRNTTRFRCKKCSHVIELHLTALGDDVSGSSPSIPVDLSVVPGPSIASTSSPAATASPAVAPAPVAAPPPPPAVTGARAGRPAPPAPRIAGVPSSSAAVARAEPAFAAPRPRPPSGSHPAVSAPRPVASPLRSALGPSVAARAEPSFTKAPPPPPPEASIVPEIAWFAGIQGTPVGPLNSAALRGRIVGGEVDGETLVWREGLDDWRPLALVAELDALFQQARAEAAATATATAIAPFQVPPSSKTASSGPEEPTRQLAAQPPRPTTPGVGATVPPANSATVSSDPFRLPPSGSPAVSVGQTAPLAFSPPANSAEASRAASAQRSSGLPAAAWILMAGVLALGVFGGVALVKFGQPETAPVAVAAPVRPAPVAAPVAPVVAAPTPVVAAAPVEPAPIAVAAGGPTTAHHPVAPVHATGLRIVDAHVGQLPSMPDEPSPGGPRGMHLALPGDGDGDGNNGGLTGAARASQVMHTLGASSVMSSCWNAALRRNPAHPGENFTVGMDVAATGRASRVTVSGIGDDDDLAACVQNRARSLMFPAGGAVTGEGNFRFTAGQ